MGGNLKNTVGRGINYKIAGFYVLSAVVLYDLSARIGLVAKHLSACRLFKLFYDFFGKAVWIGGERGL